MEDILHTSLLVTRAVSNILIGIGALAVLLASVGLYGVVSYVMTGRRRELAVRQALGATPSAITRYVLGYGLRLATAGAMIGMVLGVSVVYFTPGILLDSADLVPVAFMAAITLSAVALAACVIPARMAAGYPPATSLHID